MRVGVIHYNSHAIRPFAVGRKNWLFSSSVDGANASAVVYTMVEMAKAHGLNIYGYLKFLLEHRPGKDMTDECILRSLADSDAFQSGRCAEHNGRPETLAIIN